MKAFLCLLVVIGSFVSYLTLGTKLSFYQYHPVIHYVGMAIGIVLLIILIRKKFTKIRLVFLVFSLGVVVFTVWYTTSFSEYENYAIRIAVGKTIGEEINGITLVSSTGEKINPGAVIRGERATLFVFNRGTW